MRSAYFGSGVVGVRGSRGNEVEVPKEWTGTPDDVVKKCSTASIVFSGTSSMRFSCGNLESRVAEGAGSWGLEGSVVMQPMVQRGGRLLQML